MGIDMYLEQSKTQTTSVISMCQAQLEGYQNLQTAIQTFADDTESLQGKAYDSAREFYSSVLLPLAKGGELYAETLSSAIAKLPADYEEMVDTKSWQEEDLIERSNQEASLIAELEELNEAISRLDISSSEKRTLKRNNTDLIRGHYANKRIYDTILEDLRAYDSYSATLFNDLEELQFQMSAGIAQLDGSWNASTGTFTVPSDLSWATALTAISTSQKSVDEITKADIITDYMQTYGFDKETATILYKLQQAIIKKAKEEGWDNADVIYEFNRIVASFVYGDGIRWRGIAGVLSPSEVKELCSNYKISGAEFAKIRDDIGKQHESNSYKDFAHEAVQLAAFTERSWDWSDWTNLDGLKEVAAHIVSTIANNHTYAYRTLFGDTISIPIAMEKYEISFKGDIDSGRYDDADFNSDLDALNTYERMTDAEDIADIFKVNTKYNSDIESNQVNRVEEFYKNLGDGYRSAGKEVAKYITEADTLGSWYIQYGNDRSEEQQKQAANDFYDYLARGEEKNVK